MTDFTIPPDIAPAMAELRQTAYAGRLSKCNKDQLEFYAALLCHPQAYAHFGQRDFGQISESVRLQLLRAHLDDLDTKNAKTQRLVIALTVAALLVGIPQIWYAYRADKRAEIEQKTTAASPPTPAPRLAIPSPATPPASHPPNPKKL